MNIDEQDPLGLLTDVKHSCEDCGTAKLKKEYRYCYLCYTKHKKEEEE